MLKTVSNYKPLHFLAASSYAIRIGMASCRSSSSIKRYRGDKYLLESVIII